MENCIIHLNCCEKTEEVRKLEELLARPRDKKLTCEALFAIIEAIRAAMNKGCKFTIPIQPCQEMLDLFLNADPKIGDVVTAPDDLRAVRRTVTSKNGAPLYVAFTDQEEADEGEETSTMTESIETILDRTLLHHEVEGLVINPWTNDFILPKELIRIIFKNNLRDELKAKHETVIQFEHGDITTMRTDCIVNAANPSLLGGGGVDGAIHRAAGPQLLEECRTLGGCATGEAKITKGYQLPAAHVIHTVGPIYSGSADDAIQLRHCYWNSLELARTHKLHSIAFPAISTGAYGYPLKEATEIALATVTDWVRINPRYGMEIFFVCFSEEALSEYESVWQRIDDNWQEVEEKITECGDASAAGALLENAVQYALDLYKGALKKNTQRPAILHPLETLQILSAMQADTHLLCAGVLHDVLEETSATLLDIYERFGIDIARLVNFVSEDRRDSWYVRKLKNLIALEEADQRRKVLFIADAAAHLRQLDAAVKLEGDEAWEKIRAPKDLLAWYYDAADNFLDELQALPETEKIYWELTELFKDLFVSFAVDEEKGRLYQFGEGLGASVLKKGIPQWNPFKGQLPENASMLSRKHAERIEGNWAEPFWEIHRRDFAEAQYLIAKTSEKQITLTLREGELCFREERLSETRQESCYLLDEENTHRFLAQLRLKHGLSRRLGTILGKKFAEPDAAKKFASFCDETGVAYETSSAGEEKKN